MAAETHCTPSPFAFWECTSHCLRAYLIKPRSSVEFFSKIIGLQILENKFKTINCNKVVAIDVLHTERPSMTSLASSWGQILFNRVMSKCNRTAFCIALQLCLVPLVWRCVVAGNCHKAGAYRTNRPFVIKLFILIKGWFMICIQSGYLGNFPYSKRSWGENKPPQYSNNVVFIFVIQRKKYAVRMSGQEFLANLQGFCPTFSYSRIFLKHPFGILPIWTYNQH